MASGAGEGLCCCIQLPCVDNCITHCVVLERVEALGGRGGCRMRVSCHVSCDVCLDLQLHSAVL